MACNNCSSTRSSWLIASSTSSTNTKLLPTRFKFSGPTASPMVIPCQWRSNSHGIERNWVEAVDQSLASPERFTVASYNILGDRNATQHTDLYVNIPSRYMKWDRRKRVICDELFSWDPDIICLQEVDKYFELSKILVEAGYTGSFKEPNEVCAWSCRDALEIQ